MENGHVMFMATLFVLTAITFHVGMYVQFRQFLALCRDEETFQKTAPGSGRRVRDISTILLFFFAGFTLVPGILHLLLQPTQVIYIASEVTISALLWFGVFRYNVRHGTNKELRAAAMLLIQMLAMQLVRDFIFV